MKATLTAVLLVCTFALARSDELKCSYNTPDIITSPNWADMKDETECVASMKDQIKMELRAAMQYLAMGAHFSRDVINRPGFAKMFFEAASEEREHATKLISYLLMRGELTSVKNLINTYPEVASVSWNTGVEALKAALQLEATVTKKIKALIKTCEEENKGYNDYHLVDYLTGVFLEEQYNGQRDIAGKVSTLNKFMDKHGGLGEFLFDKKLLNGEL